MGRKNQAKQVAKPESPVASSPPVYTLSPAVRAFLSVLIALHVFAVFVGPWAMPPQASPLAADCSRVMRPYISALYLDNGYRFFAPEPGPSHLIKYRLKLAGGKIVEGQFPDRKVNWPRLLYHRHFMLSEFANTLSDPQGPPEMKADFRLYAKSYARHLARKYGAQEVRLTLVEHLIPHNELVASGKMRLEDPRLYAERPLGTYSGAEL